jgi:hypothetical protein
LKKSDINRISNRAHDIQDATVNCAFSMRGLLTFFHYGPKPLTRTQVEAVEKFVAMNFKWWANTWILPAVADIERLAK